MNAAVFSKMNNNGHDQGKGFFVPVLNMKRIVYKTSFI